MATKKTTITDIAKKTGLSTSTVSRVLNGKSEKYRIGKKSQQIVESAASELNYVANFFAANLKSGKSNSIGLIVPSLNNPFFSNIASGINSVVKEYGYNTIIAETDENVEIEKKVIEQFVSKNIEGLIIIPCGSEVEHIKRFYKQGLPLILLDRYFEDEDIPYVSTDNYMGAYMASKLLIDNGHSKIFCIQGNVNSTSNKSRILGFKKAMLDAGIEDFTILGDAFNVENGYSKTQIILRKKIRPTAIFTFSNTIAMGCLKALKEANLKIPKDISLVTFDDHPYLDYLATPLTSIAQPVRSMCSIAIKNLMSKIEKNSKFDHRIVIKPKIILRESVTRMNFS